MTSRRVMIIAALIVAGSAYFIFFKDRDDFIYLFATGLVILMITYVFQFQMDQIITRGVPQKLSPPMRQMLMTTAPYFSSMAPVQQQMVEDRMRRWIDKKDFVNKNEQDAPEDVKYILAYYAILLTMHQKSFMYDGIDRVAFYHHPFLSPAIPEDVHIAEVEPVDGTIIVSVPHLLKGYLEKGYYNIALHVIAESFAHLYMPDAINWPDDIWEQLEEISSISKGKLEAYIGLPLLDPWPVAVHHQLMYRDAQIPEVLEVFPQFKNAVEIIHP